MALSANGDRTDTRHLWVDDADQPDANNAVVPGVVRAFDASDVSKPSCGTARRTPARDAITNYAKFNPVTVYNGKVFVPTFKNPEGTNQFCVFGPLGQ